MNSECNVIVLDLETARSAEDCRHCGECKEAHDGFSDHRCNPRYFTVEKGRVFQPIGWNNRHALGLSIGGYYSYADDRVHWFNPQNLEKTVADLVERQPLMVSFNGIGFDFPLILGLLQRRADEIDEANGLKLWALCDRFNLLASRSYDILAEIWKVDPERKFEKGLNSLDAIAQANGLGAKLSHGAQAPRDWAEGRHADVLNYCGDDILKTKILFEIVVEGKPVLRGDGKGIELPFPSYLPPHPPRQKG